MGPQHERDRDSITSTGTRSSNSCSYKNSNSDSENSLLFYDRITTATKTNTTATATATIIATRDSHDTDGDGDGDGDDGNDDNVNSEERKSPDQEDIESKHNDDDRKRQLRHHDDDRRNHNHNHNHNHNRNINRKAKIKKGAACLLVLAYICIRYWKKNTTRSRTSTSTSAGTGTGTGTTMVTFRSSPMKAAMTILARHFNTNITNLWQSMTMSHTHQHEHGHKRARTNKMGSAGGNIKRGSIVPSSIPVPVPIPITVRKKAVNVNANANTNANTGINAYKTAEEAPISVLLSAAKRGTINKAFMNNTSIVYRMTMHDVSSSSSSSSKQKWRKSSLPRNNSNLTTEIVNTLMNNGCFDISSIPEPLLARIAPILLNLSPFLYLILLYHMMKKLQKGNENDDVNPTTSDDLNKYNGYGNDNNNNQMIKTTFADVAGIDNQVELEEVVSYLSDPRPYLGIGAKPPRGLLLFGPPGCGKTLLARAVAGEAKADYFLSCAGSDFVEIYVGQGSKRVRELFRKARYEALRRWKWKRRMLELGLGYSENSGIVSKAKSWIGYYCGSYGYGCGSHVNGADADARNLHLRPPTAVIFIDEIDAVSKCRDGSGSSTSFGGGGGIGGGNNDEREQTLNALLTEMDGFNQNNSYTYSSSSSPSSSPSSSLRAMTEQQVLVIVIAATNRISILDPAILRPGRFDRHVRVPPPDRKGRAAILAIHARNVNFHESVHLDDYAEDAMTRGFTGADLKNVVNEAALLTVRSGGVAVGENHMKEAVRRIQGMKFM